MVIVYFILRYLFLLHHLVARFFSASWLQTPNVFSNIISIFPNQIRFYTSFQILKSLQSTLHLGYTFLFMPKFLFYTSCLNLIKLNCSTCLYSLPVNFENQFQKSVKKTIGTTAWHSGFSQPHTFNGTLYISILTWVVTKHLNLTMITFYEY